MLRVVAGNLSKDDKRRQSCYFVAALKNCIGQTVRDEGIEVSGRLVKLKSLEKGMVLHANIRSSGFETDAFVSNTLMEMYVKCGSLADARRIFDKLEFHSIISWTLLMQGYNEHREPALALDLFSRCQELSSACQPNARTILVVLKACSSLATKEQGKLLEGKLVKLESLEKGMEIHAESTKQGLEPDTLLANTLVDFYGKCGSMVDARKVFDNTLHRSVVSWNTLMLGYVENGEANLALEMFTCMISFDNICPNALSFVAALKACTRLAATEEGRLLDGGKLVKLRSLEAGMAIHADASAAGFDTDLFVTNTLIDMYSKCGRMVEARRLFDNLQHRHSVASWNALIFGYVDSGEEELALELLSRMEECCPPSSRTFLAVLKACSGLANKEKAKQAGILSVKLQALEKGMAIHSTAKRAGFAADMFVASTLVDMYSNCGSLLDARLIFDRMESHSTVSWTALILGYAETGQGDLALDLFACMQQELYANDAFVFIAALKACVDVAAREEATEVDGKLVKATALEKVSQVHKQAIASGCDSNVFLASSLVDVFASCGSMDDACMVCKRIPQDDLVPWSALILGYSNSGQEELALETFYRMRAEDHDCSPNPVGIVGALKSCANLVALDTARRVHADLCRSGLEQNTIVANSLVDVYGKCSSMNHSHFLFDCILERDFTSWTSLMAGYCRQGDVPQALELFNAMQLEDGLIPAAVTFTVLLTGCSHTGLIDQGKEIFRLMLSKYVVRPSLEHYHCVVDILGRANQLNEAVTVVKTMPYKPSSVTWRIVLGACRKWKNVEVGRAAFERLVELNEKDAAGYALMWSLYGGVGLWDEQSRVELMRTKAGIRRKPGRSWWSDESGRVHSFVAGDWSHPEMTQIRERLRVAMHKAKEEEGYVADSACVSYNIGESEKEDVLCGHSEKLAIAFALLKTSPGKLIRIGKNLRVCDDCHAATVVIAKIERRRIVCRDASRFHVFENGGCSCGGYW